MITHKNGELHVLCDWCFKTAPAQEVFDPDAGEPEDGVRGEFVPEPPAGWKAMAEDFPAGTARSAPGPGQDPVEYAAPAQRRHSCPECLNAAGRDKGSPRTGVVSAAR